MVAAILRNLYMQCEECRDPAEQRVARVVAAGETTLGFFPWAKQENV